jgi:chromosome partitioning protein
MIVSIVNQKGGTGKTTTAINLSCALAKLNKSVLLLDMDSQGHIGYSFAITDPKITMSELLMGDAKIEQSIIKREGISIIPSDNKLVDVELNMADVSDKWFILKNILTTVKLNYDYIIIDCSPSLSLLTLNALCATDKIIVPVQLSVFDVNGIEQIEATVLKIKQVLNKELSIWGILPVNVNLQKKLSTEILEFIEENIDQKLFKSYIRNHVKAQEAPSFGKSVIAHAPQSVVAYDYMRFANELIKPMKPGCLCN